MAEYAVVRSIKGLKLQVLPTEEGGKVQTLITRSTVYDLEMATRSAFDSVGADEGAKMIQAIRKVDSNPQQS